jgi:CheY-like chemotaxis protein
MPDGGGVVLHRRVRETQREAMPAFIFITGDTAAMQVPDQSLADAAVLTKPFTAADLDVLLTRMAPVQAR